MDEFALSIKNDLSPQCPFTILSITAADETHGCCRRISDSVATFLCLKPLIIGVLKWGHFDPNRFLFKSHYQGS